jgi:hypothetical protein
MNDHERRMTMLQPRELAKTVDYELTFFGEVHTEGSVFLCQPAIPFRGQRLTIYSGTKNIIIEAIDIGNTRQTMNELPASMFRPTIPIRWREGTIFVCENILELATVNVATQVIIGVRGPNKRRFMAQIHGIGLV